MPDNDFSGGSTPPFVLPSASGSAKNNFAADALMFIVPSPIKNTVLPLAQIFGGFALDHFQKRKAVSSFLNAHPQLSRSDARKVVLGGLDAAKVIDKQLDRPVSTYTVRQVIDTMVNDGTVSSGNPVSNTFEFVSDASKGVLNLLSETPPKLATSDKLPASLTKAPDLTFGVIDSKDAFPGCVNMQGKVINISMNEETYYKICRRLRMSMGVASFLLFCITLYFIFRIVVFFINYIRRRRAALAYYRNFGGVPVSSPPSGGLSLPPKKENIFL